MLVERVDAITRYLDKMNTGHGLMDHEVLRNIKSLASQLPALDTAKLADESTRSLNSMVLLAYLSSIMKGLGMVNDVVEKYNIAYEKHSRRRGIF